MADTTLAESLASAIDSLAVADPVTKGTKPVPTVGPVDDLGGALSGMDAMINTTTVAVGVLAQPVFKICHPSDCQRLFWLG